MEVSQHGHGAAIAPLGGTVHLGLGCFTCRWLFLWLLQEDLPRFPPCLAQRMCWIHSLWKTEREGRKTERVGERGRKGWVKTRGALNYREMLTPGGDSAGNGENSPLQKRWAPVRWYLSELVSYSCSLLTKRAPDSEGCCLGSASSAALRSSMCCQCLSDFPNKEIRLPLGSVETVRMHCI